MHTIFWVENLEERDQTDDLGANVNIILEWILRKHGGKLWTGFIWLRIGTGDGLL
jgi:hypothetical protein